MARPQTQDTGINLNVSIPELKLIYETFRNNKIDWCLKLGRNGYKKECDRIRATIRRKEHPNFNAYMNKTRRAMNKRNLKQLHLDYEMKCSCCGFEGHFSQLDFHHKDASKKDGDIAHMLWRSNYKKIKIELNKCILLCSNCHRLLHWEERNGKV